MYIYSERESAREREREMERERERATQMSATNTTSGDDPPWEGRYKATWKRELKIPLREAGPPDRLDDKVNSDQ